MGVLARDTICARLSVMPTPVGHALGGLAVYLGATHGEVRRDLALGVACLGVSLLPDLDFAIGPFAGRNYHHYFTHSLGFAALFALAAYIGARVLGQARPLWDTGVLTGVYLSHILLDLLAKDTSPPFGVQIFWPFSDAFYISPIIIFDDIWRGSLAKLFGLHNWLSVGREVLILGPVIALLGWRASKPRAQYS